jgi:hypothetical protein
MNQQQLAAVRHMVEALEQSTPHLPVHTDWHFEAIAAGKALLEQTGPVQEPEPACWQGDDCCPNRYACCDAQHCLYTTPPAQPADHVRDATKMVLSDFVRSSDASKAEIMEPVIDEAIRMQKGGA